MKKSAVVAAMIVVIVIGVGIYFIVNSLNKKNPDDNDKKKGKCEVNISGNCSDETDHRYAPGTYTPKTWVLDSTDISEADCIKRRKDLSGCGWNQRSRFNGKEDGVCEVNLPEYCSDETDHRYSEAGNYKLNTWVFDSYKDDEASCAKRHTDLSGCGNGNVKTRFNYSE